MDTVSTSSSKPDANISPVSWFNYDEGGDAGRQLHLNLDRPGLQPEKGDRRDPRHHVHDSPDVRCVF